MAEPIVVSGGENKNRRVMFLAGGAAVLVLLIVVLPGMLFGGGDGGGTTTSLPPIVGAPTTVPGEAPAETFEVFSDKNPFQPLVASGPISEEPPAPAPAATADTVPPPVLVVDDVADPGNPDVGATPPGDEPTTATTAPPRQSDRVSLLEVFIDPSGRTVASVRVNDVTYQVAEGDEFASSYRMLDVDSSTRCAELLFGDDRFGLCEGEETLK